MTERFEDMPKWCFDRPRASNRLCSDGMQPAAHATADAIHFSWLVRLRWGAVAGQLLTVLAVPRYVHVALPLAALLTVIAVEAASNVMAYALLRTGRPPRAWWLAALMAFDTLLLTALLYLSGGPFNPFSFLYLVQIALAAVVLEARSTWMLVALSTVCSAVLFAAHRPLSIGGADHAEHMKVHLQGMWVAFIVAAAFIVYSLLRVTRALAERETDLAAARQVAARQEKLASLATLAAGAAHELSTPLGTIRLAAAELERSLERAPSPSPGDLREDVRLIRSQVERCREILERMAADAGQSAGEGLEEVPVGELVERALRTLQPTPAVQLSLDDTVRGATVRLPPRAVAGAVRALCKNAQQASADGGVVEVGGSLDEGMLRLSVRDRGVGMSPEVLAHAGEPFFTTKPPGAGMGLGLFLARALAQRLGGELSLDSRPGQGTVATLALPRAARLPDGGEPGAILLRRDA